MPGLAAACHTLRQPPSLRVQDGSVSTDRQACAGVPTCELYCCEQICTPNCCRQHDKLYCCRHNGRGQFESGTPVMTAARSRCGLEAAEQLEPGLGWSLCSSACATSVVLLSSTYFSRRGSTANARASAPAGIRDVTRGKAAGRWSRWSKGIDSNHTRRQLVDLSYVL